MLINHKKLRYGVNSSDSLTHVQRSSTCMVVSSYYNIPTDFISSQQQEEAMSD
jgi:hypothetical protein